MLGRRWNHSDRRDRSLDNARKMYERLPALDGDAAVRAYHQLIDITDAWRFLLRGAILVAPRPVGNASIAGAGA